MAWEIRSGRRVYYRSRRVGRKVVRDYFSGQEARLAAALDQQRRVKRGLAFQALQADRANWSAASAPLNELITLSDILVTAALLAEGYYLHGRRTWRRRRER